MLINSRGVTGTFDDASLPPAAAVPARLNTLGFIARLWRGDSAIQELPYAARGFLWDLHVLAVDRGTWPFVPADIATLGSMLGQNPRPVATFLRILQPAGFVQAVPDDLTRLRLREIDALIRWRPLSDLH